MASLRAKRGNAVLEFTLVGVPMIFIFVGVVAMSLGMWTYHSMAHAVASATRVLVVHGAGCTGAGIVTVNGVARLIAAKATGVPASYLNVTLVANAGSASAVTRNCHPLTTCYDSTDRWPPAGSNAQGMNVRVTARYAVALPGIYWPGAAELGARANTLGASAQEPIQF